MVVYAVASPVNAAYDYLSNDVVYCNLYPLHVVLGTMSLLT